MSKYYLDVINEESFGGCVFFLLKKGTSWQEKDTSLAFGNKVAKVYTTPLNKRATCASALPTNSKFAGAPLSLDFHVVGHVGLHDLVGGARIAMEGGEHGLELVDGGVEPAEIVGAGVGLGMVRDVLLEDTEDREPVVHLRAGVGGGIDAFESKDFEDMMEPPTVFGREDPFEIIGAIVEFIAVFMVTFELFDLTGCRVELGFRSRSVEGNQHQRVAVLTAIAYEGSQSPVRVGIVLFRGR